nr:unnamed protein product [Digitaria exilis]
MDAPFVYRRFSGDDSSKPVLTPPPSIREMALLKAALDGDLGRIKGIPVDVDCGHGTPLYHASVNEQDKTVKILLNHNANPNTIFCGFGTPLSAALIYRSLKCMKLLIKASIFLPFLFNYQLVRMLMAKKEEHIKVRKATIRSQADKAFRQKEYDTASKFYTVLIDVGPDATLYSNRSLCKLNLGDGEGALSDAYQCRMLRPDWAKAFYRQATAHMLLKEYKQARDALLDVQKLDPGNDEIERELSTAMELMKNSPDEDEQ